MTRILSTDENNDIFIGGDGRLAISNGIDAVLQACAHAAKAQLGEMIYAVDKGIPTFDTVWNGSPNLGQFEAALRVAFTAVSGVVRIVDFSASNMSGVLKYSATIETIYGEGAING